MNDPLANLKDIHLPAPVSAWPIAPGWWALLILLTAIIAGCIYAALFYKRRHAWRKMALAELEKFGRNQQDFNIEQLANLVRRAAISAEKAYRKQPVAAQLHGKDWQHFLQRHMSTDSAYALAIGRYEGKITINNDRLISDIAQWLKRHTP